MRGPIWVLSCFLTCGTAATLVQSSFAPLSWGLTSLCIWLLFALSKGWTDLKSSDKYHLAWGWTSTAAFITFIRIYDPSFKVGQSAAPGTKDSKSQFELYRTSERSSKQTVRAQGWGDVYYFCGSQGRYCSCDMRWNLAGWYKAAVLWNFVLTTSLAIQKLLIQEGLKGLLPGQDCHYPAISPASSCCMI